MRWIVLSLMWAALASTGFAQSGEVPTDDAQARGLYEAGARAFDAGEFQTALQRFEAAYALSPRPQLLYNVGTAADRLRQNERALEAFEAYVEQAPNAPNRAQAEARMEVLRESIANERRLEASLENAVLREEEVAAADRARRTRRRVGFSIGGILLAGGLAALAGLLATRDNRRPPLDQGDLPGGVVMTLGRSVR